MIEVVSTDDVRAAYRAHHRQWGVDLIVNVPSPALAAGPGLLREWVKGIERWAGLGVHPHIVSCYSLQWLDGVPLAITEAVGADTLKRALAQGRYGDLQAALKLAMDVCQGLEHAHERGVVHGNLGADTILLTPQGAPKLSTFDMAVAVGTLAELAPGRSAPASLTLASDAPASTTPARNQETAAVARPILCAPASVAPERWGSGYTAQPAADVFALGVCLYELFFGRFPYAGTEGAPCLPPEGVPTSCSPSPSGATRRRCGRGAISPHTGRCRPMAGAACSPTTGCASRRSCATTASTSERRRRTIAAKRIEADQPLRVTFRSRTLLQFS